MFLVFTFCLGSFRQNFTFKFSSESCKGTTEENYQDVNESFCIIISSFLMSILTHYWQKWFFDVSLYSPWSAYLFETHLFGFYFYITLWTANYASFFEFNLDGEWFSHSSICLCLWTANNALIFVVFLLIYVAYHVTFYSVVDTPILPQVVFNSLMLYNNVSSFYLLSGEFQLKFKI